MKKLIMLLCLTSCTSTPLQKKRTETLNCVKDLIGNDASPLDSYSICKDVYGTKK